MKQLVTTKLKSGKLHFLWPIYILLVAVMFVLPLFSFEEYSILTNTTSHLGAQNTPNAWVMNLVFVLLGLTAILEGWFHLHRYWFQKILITIFGAALVCTAIFQHAPIVEGITYSPSEDRLHSLFAGLVGFSFTIFALSVEFIVADRLKKALALLIALAAVALSMLIFNIPEYAGIFQRVMFLIAFGWLIYFFHNIESVS